jgi:sugar/nucleoside kinase (ribokinase family)
MKEGTMGLLVLGTVALDNVQTPSGIKKNMLGGSAAHFAMSARIFDEVNVVGVVGTDFPSVHLDFMKRKGANLSALTIADGETFRWTGEYCKEDLNTALTRETRLGVLAEYVPVISEAQKKMAYVFLANLAPSVQEKMLRMMSAPAFVGLDTMNLWITTALKDLRRILKKVNLLVLNDAEAGMLTGERNCVRAARILRGMGPRIVVIKKGEHGVYVYGGTYEFGYPAFPIEKVIDPTGAGDTFAGALFGHIARTRRSDEKTLRRAAVFGTVLASFNVEGFGMARTAPLTMREVEKRVKEYQKFCEVV